MALEPRFAGGKVTGDIEKAGRETGFRLVNFLEFDLTLGDEYTLRIACRNQIPI